MLFVSRFALNAKKDRVVILGSGWGGAHLAKNLDPKYYDVTIVSPRNHFVFTPFLPSVSAGRLPPQAAIEPIHTFKHVAYVEATAEDIKVDEKLLECESLSPATRFDLPYDKLVVAVGAQPNTFSIPGVEEHAFFMKESHHARRLRESIIDHFERASLPTVTTEEQKELLHIVIVGGGPTGVETAGELNDLINATFPALRDKAKITVVEMGTRVLASFNEEVSLEAAEYIKSLGVDLMLQSGVTEVTAHSVKVRDTKTGLVTEVPCGAVVWCSGVKQVPFTARVSRKLQPTSKLDRFLVDARFHVHNAKDVYAIGDCAYFLPEGQTRPLPLTAQVARQQALYIASEFNYAAKNHLSQTEQDSRPKFEFHNRGQMTYLGGYKAILETAITTIVGTSSVLAWRTAYATMQLSLKNAMRAVFGWLKTDVMGYELATDIHDRKKWGNLPKQALNVRPAESKPAVPNADATTSTTTSNNAGAASISATKVEAKKQE